MGENSIKEIIFLSW